MAWLRRAIAVTCLALLGAVALTLAEPSPSQARANAVCDAAGPITGGTGIGNFVGDACKAVSKPVLGAAGHVLDPLKDAATSIGRGVFDQIAGWASDGAVWLLGEVVALTEKTTSPDLTHKGFLRSYRQMASIAVVLAMAALLLAIFESLARNEEGMLLRVFFVHVPLAAIATSAAFVVVQLLIVATDGLCDLVTHSAAEDTRIFFKGALKALGELGGKSGAALGAATGPRSAGAAAGAATGGTAVPLFVGFIVAIVAAMAAFFVWIELLMRDAAIYAVASFMPFAIAAAVRPRWLGALRRAAELIFVVVASKFVIVAIIALAASLLAGSEGKVEPVLAASALLLLAAFSPLLLFRWIGFAEHATGAAFGRQSAAGASMRSVQHAHSAQGMRRAAHANWNSRGGTLSLLDATEGSKAKPGAGGSRGSGGTKPSAAGGSAASGSAAAAGGVAAVPAVAAGAAAQVARGAAGAAGAAGGALPTSTGTGGGDGASRQKPSDAQAPGESKGSVPAAEPSQASGGEAPRTDSKPPRPSAEAAKPAEIDSSGSKGK